jgi:hypothetical protein
MINIAIAAGGIAEDWFVGRNCWISTTMDAGPAAASMQWRDRSLQRDGSERPEKHEKQEKSGRPKFESQALHDSVMIEPECGQHRTESGMPASGKMMPHRSSSTLTR